MASLNLRQIEVFRAVMTTGTIAGASQLLFVSQPAVSRLLAHTEQRIGFPLFQRIKGRLFATPEAKKLFHAVEHVYESVQRVNHLAKDLALNRTGILNLVSSPSVGQSLIPQAVANFRDVHPDCKVTFACHSYEHIQKLLLSHQADLGIISLPLEHPNLEITPLCLNRLVCILHESHPLGAKDILSLDDLCAWPMIGYGADTPMGRLIAKHVESHGRQLSTVVEVGSPQNAGSMVETGMGIALVDEFSVRSWSKARPILVRHFDDAPMLEANLVHLRYEPPAQLTRSFIQVLRELLVDHGFESLEDPAAELAAA